MNETKNIPPENFLWKSAKLKDSAGSAASSAQVTALSETFREFPDGHFEERAALSRRSFLGVTAAALGLGALSGCTEKRVIQKFVPYVEQPKLLTHGDFLPFATSQVIEGLATGLVVRSFEGRPIKIDGNSRHPASLGGSSAIQQAHLLGLFREGRLQGPRLNGAASSWDAFRSFCQGLPADTKLRVLTEISTSPSLASLMKELTARFPKMKWIQHDPLYRTGSQDGAELAFGQRLDPLYDLTKADLVVSLDADFLGAPIFPIRYVQDFASRRRGENQERNFLWMAECSPTLTGANADRRQALSPAELEAFALALEKGQGPAALETRRRQAGKRVLFLAGEYQPASVHAICHLLNARAGAVGETVVYRKPVREAAAGGLKDLAAELEGGEVDFLLCLGGNPIYSAPADLRFAEAVGKAKHRAYLTPCQDESSEAFEWLLPLSHPLEAWGDALAFDGSLTYQQPLIAPLFDSKDPLACVDLVRGGNRDSRALVKTGPGLEDGFVQAYEKPVPVKAQTLALPAPAASSADGSLTLVFRPDAFFHDGRFFHYGWLQELPRPLTQLVWGNALLLSPATARAHKLENGQVVEVESQGRKLEAPIWIQPGHGDRTATLILGYGQKYEGETYGHNAFTLVTTAHPDSAPGTIRPTGRREALVSAQEHAQLDARKPIHFIRPAEVKTAAKPAEKPLSLYPQPPQPQDAAYAWGLSIDLSRCIGCGACTAACQAENNIPVVGKEQVANSREMHWIRVDRYFEGEEADAKVHFQPVPCMQCEKAPCEPVCPVGATLHNTEGLNQMVYNRCVGTRYCSNNCPYKVRRFNFLEYNKTLTPLERLAKNPDVSVRPRGVMEKCTYCVQRIEHAHIHAEKTKTKIDGLTTACQDACPARAISFGNIADPQSEVSQWKRKNGDYALLAELGTRPRTTYLAKVREEGHV